MQQTTQRIIGDLKGFRPATITGDTDQMMIEDDEQVKFSNFSNYWIFFFFFFLKNNVDTIIR